MKWSRGRSAVAASFLATLLTAAFPAPRDAQSRIDPQLIGEWLANVPGSPLQFVFRIEASGQCGLEDDVGTCQAQGGVLIFKSPSTGENRYSYRLQGGRLTLSGGDIEKPLVFRRIGEAPPDNVTKPPENPGANVQESPAPTEAPARSPAGLAGYGGIQTQQPSAPAKPPRARRGLTEAEVIQLLEGSVPSPRLMDLAEEKGVGFAVTPAVAARLKAKGATDELISVLRKWGGAPATGAPSPAKESPSALGNLGAGQVAGRSQSPASRMASSASLPARGQRYTKDNWGLNFLIPEAWKVGERGGALLVGSDTEAGLMVIRFLPKAGLGELQQLYAQGIQEEGFQAFPQGPTQEFRAGSLRGISRGDVRPIGASRRHGSGEGRRDSEPVWKRGDSARLDHRE